MKTREKINGHWMRLQGESGVQRVASELLMRGHVPCVPMVDYGFDLVLCSGIKLQVKTCMLKKSHISYQEGIYRLDIRDKPGRRTRELLDLCDFFVLWLIDEDRFFVLPCSGLKKAAYFIKPKGGKYRDLAKHQVIFDMLRSGMTRREIAEEIGTTTATISRVVAGRFSEGQVNVASTILEYENRWDLLDVNKTSEALIESAKEMEVSG